MNHMPEIAKMLGVEMGETFRITGFDNTDFYLSEKQLCTMRADIKGIANDILRMLITGDLKIIKLPFEPEKGKLYYTWWINGRTGKAEVVCYNWHDVVVDRLRYMLGNCYRTEQECLADTAMKERLENMERCKW